MTITVQQVSKSFGSFAALNNINLSIKTGELVALLGPSGSGKTTLLRLLSGLEMPDTGSIFFDHQDVTYLDVPERRVGFVFQHYALFRHMNVFDNVAFGLQVRPRKVRPTSKEIRERVEHLLRLVQLEGLQNRYPSQLSGGQRQRVALARALALEPKVLLLDEPFGALDAKVRLELRKWLRHLHETLQITCVFVTHDQEEALELADRVVIMNNGRIEQIGVPEQVYHQPVNSFVYTFLGRVNQFQVAKNEMNPTFGYVRPHELELSREMGQSTSIRALIKHIFSIGPIKRMECKRLDTGELFEVEMSEERFSELALQKDECVFVTVKQMKLFQDIQSIPM